ncbi:hypothetical protein KDX30_15510 [Pseudomonas sp. CDFA 553]|uniref:hypothetical protein n=1 Tax=Pseudomonas quasicaspiana TaxID=2829821 RepID=UPI001E3F7E09|nr:hypothetical protein [Pseudomonas quasicaspiana]MCD5989309.1 hypothetical protein [Pseudomonas quasicaspiana]
METRDIFIKIDGHQKKATMTYDTDLPSIRLDMENLNKTCYEVDLFTCFVKLRQELPDITFLCKGAKINVYPSRMSSQMSSGLMAYELELGKQALKNNIVNIFDYEEEDLTNDPTIQSTFYADWTKSLRTL